jgi:hypothetical protein
MLRRASIMVRFLTLCALSVSAVRFCSEVIISHDGTEWRIIVASAGGR